MGKDGTHFAVREAEVSTGSLVTLSFALSEMGCVGLARWICEALQSIKKNTGEEGENRLVWKKP